MFGITCGLDKFQGSSGNYGCTFDLNYMLPKDIIWIRKSAQKLTQCIPARTKEVCLSSWLLSATEHYLSNLLLKITHPWATLPAHYEQSSPSWAHFRSELHAAQGHHLDSKECTKTNAVHPSKDKRGVLELLYICILLYIYILYTVYMLIYIYMCIYLYMHACMHVCTNVM